MSEPTQSSSRAHVLIVEDSSVFREMQGLLLRQAGYAVSAHEHPEAALAAAKERTYDLVIIDYELPGMNGQQFMHALRAILPNIAVVFVSGSLTLELAIALSRQGVAGIFNKPANPKTLLEKINETLSRTGAQEAAKPGRSNAPLPAARRGNSNSPFATATAAAPAEPTADKPAYAPQHFLGRSDRFRDFSHRLWKVRDFRAVLLLQGEAGSPFAPLAHDLTEISIFRDGPIMLCDAASFDARHLIEVLAPSLLSQDAGTLVVTGVESFTAEQQKILENVMAGRDVFQPFARHFRIVLAAGANLSDAVDAGRFGENLFYKISALSLTVPPLRELRGDLALNAQLIVDEHGAATNTKAPFALTPAAAEWIEAQNWPGNYDQLSRVLIGAAGAGLKIDVPVLAASLAQDDEKFAQPLGETPPDAPARTKRTRSPFPTAPDAAAAPVAKPAVEPVIQSVVAAPPPARSEPRRTEPVERAPDRAPALTARSIFRPPTGAYDFSKRLAASLATADSAAAS